MEAETENQQLDNIFRNYNRLVSSISRKMIMDQDIARDAAQEVWLEIVKSIDNFRGESKLSTWIYTIACRVIMRYSHKEKTYSTKHLSTYFRDGEREIPVNIDYDESIWIKEMCDKCLTGILHCLGNEPRIIYIFREIAELPYADISEITGRDEPAVRKLVSRARSKLRNFLNDECALYNPAGNCNCRMKKHVMKIDLPGEFLKLRKTVSHIHIFQESEKVMPKIEYWKKIL